MIGEAALLSLGATAAKTALKIWAADNVLARDLSSSTVDILAARVKDTRAQRSLGRQIGRAEELIADRLSPLVETEFRGLPENERVAAIEAVAGALDRTPVDLDAMLGNDFDPLALERQAQSAFRKHSRHLGEPAKELARLLLRESCNYIVEIGTTLPGFERRSTLELLRRDTEIIQIVSEVLDRIPENLSAFSRDASDEFESQYLRSVARKLDKLNLYGLDTDEFTIRYSLTISYITLSSTKNVAGRRAIDDAELTDSNGLNTVDQYLAVDEALGSADRVLVRGHPGSGKSTLLQWIAVNAARRSFEGPLRRWNDRVPFFIQLRHFAATKLPDPEEFTSTMMSVPMPSDWVFNVLESGRGIVLVDGLDELPKKRRGEALSWIKELMNSFEDCVYVLTSRPPALTNEWLRLPGLALTDLQPMRRDQIKDLIDRWHDAAIHELRDNLDEIEEVLQGKRRLKDAVEGSTYIGSLAETPLLCAMICAITRQRRGHLPHNRQELYRTTVSALLERDARRHIGHAVLSQLEPPQRELLLQHVAYWLLRNGYSDATREDVSSQLFARSQALKNVDIDEDQLYEGMLSRSGLLREPVPGRVDFTHRTFLEYLAAAESINQGDVGSLVKNALDDQWQVVIVFAAGLAQRRQRERLLTKLLERGDEDDSRRHSFHLLAVACLETSPELSPSLSERIRAALEKLLPPQNLSEADAVAQAGPIALPLLTDLEEMTATEARACIRAVATIGSSQPLQDEALASLSRFGTDRRVTVARELIKAWHLFPVQVFAQRVLAKSPLVNGSVAIEDPSLLPGLRFLEELKNLDLMLAGRARSELELGSLDAKVVADFSGSPLFDSADGVRDLPNLRSWTVDSCENLASLRGIEHCIGLQHLSAAYCSALRDVPPLQGLRSLDTVNLRGCDQLRTLRFLDGTEVSEINIDGTNIVDLSPVPSLSSLSAQSISGLKLESLATTDCLERLRLADLQVDQLGEVANVAADLSHLRLSRCSGPTPAEWAASLKQLTHLSLVDCSDITELDFASEEIVWLDLSRCTSLSEVELPTGVRVLSLTSTTSLRDYEQIANLDSLEVLSVAGAGRMPSLDIFSHLRRLRIIDVRGLESEIDFPYLAEHVPSLRTVVVSLSWLLRSRVGAKATRSFPAAPRLPASEDRREGEDDRSLLFARCVPRSSLSSASSTYDGQFWSSASRMLTFDPADRDLEATLGADSSLVDLLDTGSSATDWRFEAQELDDRNRLGSVSDSVVWPDALVPVAEL